jgi:predicted phosphodiesterase/predicted transcriptional regulator
MKVNDNKYDERLACLSLKEKGLSRKEIAERLGITERQVKRRLSAGENGNLNRAKFGCGEARIDEKRLTSIKNGIGLDEDYFGAEEDSFSFPMSKDKSLFRHEIGDQKRQELASYIERKYKGRKVKMLYLADLHIPFTMYKEVMNAVKKHSDADIVVINGDLLDLFAVSKFAKDKEVALRRELEEGRELLEFLSKRFKDVIITEGNHERRLKSYIRNIIPTDLQFLFPDDVLQMVVSGEVLGDDKDELDNVHVVGSWWIKLFDTIFAHPDNYSSANLKTVQNTSEFFTVVKNVAHRACIIGHTHRAGWLISGEVLLMETGCMCYDMDYHNGSNFTRTKWTRSYATVTIDEDGAVVFNDTELHII